ncbi:MAG: GMC family oxidoreductase [Deltaproteobacteria bacterium]|nr:GMC family oxidoreductase [Deltaproteobacteria bacterium]
MTGTFDAVVVGSGAGGGVAAYVLAARGWKVALVEKGRNPYPALADDTLRGSLLGNDEIKSRRFYAYQDPLLEPRLFRESPSATAAGKAFQSLGVCVGGGTVQYDADSPRLQRTDLRMREAYGAVQGADVVDWPISYDDLVPFYDAAEHAVGVQGQRGADPFAEPRADYPMPPGHPARGGIVLSEAARRLGYHPHPMPMAINSMAYGGRPACVNCGFCNMGCPANAKGSTAVTVIRDALRTGNVTLLANHCVLEVTANAAGDHASGVRCVGPDGAEVTLGARHVLLGANALETPRLLLTSRGGVGLGNSSGLVGRYLMFHVIFAAIGIFPFEIRAHRGRVITHAMADFTVPDGTGDYVRGGYTELGGSIHPVAAGVQFPWLLGKTLMTDGRYWRRLATVSMIGEDVPVLDNRVDVDPAAHDVYGRPAVRVTYGRHPRDQALVDRYMPRMVRVAREAGATDVMEMDFAREDGAPDTKHLLGTTRMGTDPATAVTNPWGRLHDVDNVWVVDGGVFPTSTGFNPTLTQQALAWRTAAYLADPTDVRP